MKNVATACLVLWSCMYLCYGCSKSSEAKDVADLEDTVCYGETAACTKEAKKPVVVHIAFLDLKQCCACTRRRIDSSWAALQAVVGSDKSIQVDRVHIDTQKSQAEIYRRLRPMQFVPAIYFLDSNSGLVDMLQGEVSEKALRKILK